MAHVLFEKLDFWELFRIFILQLLELAVLNAEFLSSSILKGFLRESSDEHRLVFVPLQMPL